MVIEFNHHLLFEVNIGEKVSIDRISKIVKLTLGVGLRSPASKLISVLQEILMGVLWVNIGQNF